MKRLFKYFTVITSVAIYAPQVCSLESEFIRNNLARTYEGTFQWHGPDLTLTSEKQNVSITVSNVSFDPGGNVIAVGVGEYNTTRGKTKIDVRLQITPNTLRFEMWETIPEDTDFITEGSHVGLISEDLKTINAVWTTTSTGEQGELFLSAWTPLMIAVAEGNEEVVSVLIRGGADVNGGNSSGRTALMFAARYGYTAIALALIDAGAETDLRPTTERRMSALIVAALYGHEATARLLLERGADIEITDAYGSAALTAAVEGGHAPVVRLLLARGANPHATAEGGYDAMSAAALGKDVEVVELLLEVGGNPNRRNAYGKLTTTVYTHPSDEEMRERVRNLGC